MANEFDRRYLRIVKSGLNASVQDPSVYRDVTFYDSNGEVVKQVAGRVVPRNEGGFVMSYTEKMLDFLKSVSSPAIIRVFLFIAHNQHYGDGGIYGYRCSRKYLTEVLHLDRKSVYSALKYLLDNFLVVENRFDGQLEFMVNPEYVTIGSDRKARIREWSRRWEWYFKNKERLRQNKNENSDLAI